MNRYFKQYSLQSQKRGMVRNYVVTRNDSLSVAAFYSLVYSALDPQVLSANILKGLGRYDIPIMLLARLAVDLSDQGQGLGRAMLKDAAARTAEAAKIAGLKLLIVHAKDETAAEFYKKHGFVSLTDRSLRLFLPIELGQ